MTRFDTRRPGGATLLACLIALTAAPAVGLATRAVAAATAPAGPAVSIANFTFGPAALSVRVGATVTWINDDDIPHTVVAVDHSFKSRTLDTGDRFAFTFTKPGEYAYFCSLHPHMMGKVIVRAS